MKITVTTAEKLNANQLKTIKSAISKKHPKLKLDIHEKLDENLIGGLQIMIGSKMYDASVKNKLAEIKTQLIKLN
ncbi:MAG: F0F1 ATP synthase subunit delta [Patescibacteria group bacterium]